jgi:hypothetical protein
MDSSAPKPDQLPQAIRLQAAFRINSIAECADSPHYSQPLPDEYTCCKRARLVVMGLVPPAE